VGAKWGLKSVPDACLFCRQYIRDDFSATSQRPIFAKFGHETWIVGETQNSDRNLWKVSIQGSFAPKTPNFEGSNRYLTQSRLQVKGYTAEIYCLFHVVVQGPESLRYPVNFSVGRTVAELRGFGFSDFGLFSPYKTRKTYLPVTSLQPRGYIAEWFRFFHVVVEGPEGCLQAAEFFYGELWTPNLPKFSPTKCYYTARHM